jgi:hypothetical protein
MNGPILVVPVSYPTSGTTQTVSILLGTSGLGTITRMFSVLAQAPATDAGGWTVTTFVALAGAVISLGTLVVDDLVREPS